MNSIDLWITVNEGQTVRNHSAQKNQTFKLFFCGGFLSKPWSKTGRSSPEDKTQVRTLSVFSMFHNYFLMCLFSGCNRAAQFLTANRREQIVACWSFRIEFWGKKKKIFLCWLGRGQAILSRLNRLLNQPLQAPESSYLQPIITTFDHLRLADHFREDRLVRRATRLYKRAPRSTRMKPSLSHTSCVIDCYFKIMRLHHVQCIPRTGITEWHLYLIKWLGKFILDFGYIFWNPVQQNYPNGRMHPNT